MSKICSFRVEGKKAKVTRVFTNGIRFCCIRCARLCCKLGGPRLTKDDMVRLERIGFRAEQISDSEGVLRKRPNGECIFLQSDQNNAQYECEIQEHKPLLCRAFPFFVESSKVDGEYTLVALPCHGLSFSEGTLIGKDFIQNKLGPTLFALVSKQRESRTKSQFLNEAS